MDIQIPEMNGLEAARRIREIWPSTKQPKIIAMTAYFFDDEMERCLQAGMNGYIAKPVKMESLNVVLDA